MFLKIKKFTKEIKRLLSGEFYIEGPNLPGHRRDWAYSMRLNRQERRNFLQSIASGKVYYNKDKNRDFQNI